MTFSSAAQGAALSLAASLFPGVGEGRGEGELPCAHVITKGCDPLSIEGPVAGHSLACDLCKRHRCSSILFPATSSSFTGPRKYFVKPITRNHTNAAAMAENRG